MPNVIGVTLGHDASAALVRYNNGEVNIVAAVSEERFSRAKSEDRFPLESLRYIVDLLPAGELVDSIVYSSWERDEAYSLWDRWLRDKHGVTATDYLQNLKTDKDIYAYRKRIAEDNNALKEDQAEYKKMMAGFIRERLGLDLKAEQLIRKPHHLSHAACAWFLSGFRSCYVITMDGFGDGLSITTNKVEISESSSTSGGLPISNVASVGVEGSLGVFYQYITKGLGFKKLEHEGKVTGLAAFGNPATCFQKFYDLFLLDELYPGVIKGWNVHPKFASEVKLEDTQGGDFHPIGKWVEYKSFGRQVMSIVRDLLNQGIEPKDIAAGAQAVVENIAIKIVRQLLLSEQHPVKLAVGGGLFANVKLNQHIAECAEVEELFVAPPMGDPGNAIGSAILHAYKTRDRSENLDQVKNLKSMALGPSFSNPDIEKQLQSFKNLISYQYVGDNIDIWNIIAKALARGKSVARFQGRLEFGPRALGNRSIYVSALDVEVSDVLNTKLHRNEFMPFAPATLIEHAGDCYYGWSKVSECARYMTISLPVTPEFSKIYPAATHIDGTARPQLVDESMSDMHGIIQSYYQITGFHTIINTSFNIHGESIVCTPYDALNTFIAAELDILAMENYIVTRK